MLLQTCGRFTQRRCGYYFQVADTCGLRNIHLAGHIYQDNEDLFEKGVKLLEKVANDESFFLAEDALEKLYEKFRHLGKELYFPKK